MHVHAIVWTHVQARAHSHACSQTLAHTYTNACVHTQAETFSQAKDQIGSVQCHGKSTSPRLQCGAPQ